ncbi:MAG: PAS domain-containing sensor histidine kinase, partial [Rhodospirillales bacterium]|nr:PAS domain-containing sensor histidine kinase [Rhodospirillales bacterium]
MTPEAKQSPTDQDQYSTIPQDDEQSRLSRTIAWFSKGRNTRRIAYLIAACAAISGTATAMSMTGEKYDLQQVLYLLYVDMVFMILLAGLVIAKLTFLFQAQRRGKAGAGLHTQLVIMFSLIAVTPAVMVAIFAAIYFNVGLQGWFSDRVKAAIEGSAQISQSYLQEHKQNISAKASAMANDLNRESANLSRNRLIFNRFLTKQTSVRGLAEAIVVDSDGRVLARSLLSQALEFDLAPQWAFEQAATGEIVVLTSDKDDRVRAVVNLNQFVDAYLLVGRFVDARVIEHVERVERGARQYKSFEEKKGGLQITFVVLFVVVAVLVLLAAAWVGLNFATQFANPIGRLVGAAEQIRDGNLKVSLPESSSLGEIETLMRAFNKMTHQLASQQEGLLEANRLLDERREFTEAVLSGVSAGVIGLDSNCLINLPNRSASELIEIDLNAKVGEPLQQTIPEMADLANAAKARPDRLQQDEIRIERENYHRVFMVKIVSERIEGGEVIGFVVTFDDITDLQSAQRQAAWADIARRIAHEIKNPLTPIQLSAERLKRKYLKEITSDKETFQTCTDTIIRQVGDIGRMVDEFSAFARMPEPSIKQESLSEICEQTAFLERNRNGDVNVNFIASPDDIKMDCDRGQITQAMTNLIKNATESVLERIQNKGKNGEPGLVSISLSCVDTSDNQRITISVEDNGIGLPEKERERLTEPYVTNRDKGTGLGLA